MAKFWPAASKAWEGFPPVHRLSAAALAASYASLALIWLIGTAVHWDGQGAILVLPLTLIFWAAAPASVVIAFIGLWTKWQISLWLLLASLPLGLLLWAAAKG